MGMGDDEIADRLKAEAVRLVAAGSVPAAAADFALSAAWPQPVLELSSGEREARVRRGGESVILDGETRRGFVRAVLRVPLGNPRGQVYGVFVEVDREGYALLSRAFQSGERTEVWGTLATRLPLLDAAYGARVLVLEDGGEMRARVVDTDSDILRLGPAT